jgi:hypothetical protein
MNLTLADGTSLTVTIIGYQYPQLSTEPYDSNWLMIHIHATNSQGTWSATDPCLLTYEVSRLADWLEGVAVGTNTKTTCRFIEPCLHFQLDKDAVGKQELRIYLELELRPPWAPSKYAGQEDLWLAFPRSLIDLQAAATMLRHQLDQYPQRADR